jgi:hypothetical protein
MRYLKGMYGECDWIDLGAIEVGGLKKKIERRRDNEASGSAMTKAAAVRQGRQRWRNDKCRTGVGAMTKAKLAARQGMKRRLDKEGRSGAITKAELAAQR